MTISTTTSPCADTQPPTSPTGLTTSNVSQTGLSLAWTAASDNVAVTGYDIYRNGAKLTSTQTTSSTQTGLVCGTPYTFGVVAYDAAGNRSSQAQVNVTTTPCAPSSGGEPAPIAGQGYHQAWAEEFNDFNLGSWSQGIWYSPSAPANSISVQNGVLNLVSRRSQGYQDITVTTEAGASPRTFTQGYFEARMKWTKGAGAWPGFWLLSYRHSVNDSWPSINPYCAANGLPAALCYSAELDVFEGQGREPSVFYGTIHRNSSEDYGVQNTQNSNNYHDVGVDLTADFHVYGMMWTASTISWYLDGKLIHSAPVYDSTNQPMFVLLQMWIGGWTGGTTTATPDELKTEVDWVRVWQK